MTTNWKRVLGLGTTLAGAALLSTSAAAQTNCNASVGPDVIVGDIQDIANYASAGGTLEALSLGTYSCNIGTVNVQWIANNNQHPVIGGNLYKWKMVNGAGRFEQIGMSWLKHGFLALSNTLCCTGCQATSGSSLGVHCADPYTAVRNGGQSGAGPRYQVNAATGVFTYPPANPGFSGSTARRLEVAIADLEASSATVRYYGEAQYVTQDDAAAGNDNNNASYKEVTVSGSGTSWTFGLTGTTQREQDGTAAWVAAEAGVQRKFVDIAGDGRMILAYKVTNLGAGQWHYEYAIHNLNSDLSGQSFAVPIGAAVLSNVAFHDVVYRNGDGIGNVAYDGTDWPSTQNAGVITWAGQTFAQNTNANALRWGTMYTFRFDSNLPPTSGNVTIGLFKGGSPQVVTGVDVPGGAVGGAIVSICDPGAGGVIGCPCGNPAISGGFGCDNSDGTGGAQLSGTGTAALSGDTVVFSTLSEKPTATSIVLQGDAVNATGSVFGQGVRCVAGNLKRLYVKNAVAGSITAPTGGDPAVSVRSAALGDVIPSGAHRYYGVYYRDPIVLGGCPASNTFNATNSLDATWAP